MSAPDRLDDLVAAVWDSPKYRAVSRELVVDIGSRELRARRSFKDAVKATKNKLHQVAGAFLDSRPRYDEWRALIHAAGQDETRVRAACLQIMDAHASTRERIAILPDMYDAIFAALPPVRSVVDLACGFNPLALPWMPLAPNARYIACDIYYDMAAFLGFFFAHLGIDGQTDVCNLVTSPPPAEVDLALLLKVLPTLEHLERDAGARLLRELRARAIVVSFPARSLGGRNKQMVATYGERFEALAAAEGWVLQRWEFSTELVFLVAK